MSEDLFSVNRLYARAVIQSADRLALALPAGLRRAVEDHARLPLATLDLLWDAYCGASADPLAGLRLGLELQAGHLDCAGMLLASCDTLGEALEQLVEVAPIVGEGGDFVVENDGDLVAVHYRPHLATRQAERVEATAAALLAQVAERWELQDPECGELLGWAARMHEVGLDIAHAQHQLHAAYLLRNADLAGFTLDQQRRLAVLVGNHRRKVRDELLDGLQEPWTQRIPYLLVLLRLAVLLHRSRSATPVPPLSVEATKRKLRLNFPPGWLDTRPLTRADLEQEARYLGALDIKLSYS